MIERRVLITLVMLLSPMAAQARKTPSFVVPLACDGGRDRFVQNCFDHDSGPGVADFTCASRTRAL